MSWDKQQERFANSLLDPSSDVPDFVSSTAGEASNKRFDVYRNNVMVSLTDALLDTYPVVAELVGEEFATAMAQVFVGGNLPSSPVLLAYGESYGDFIKGFEPAQSLPYLADIAHLEWAWLQAYHSADKEPLAIDALSRFAEDEFINLRFTFCPAVRLLQSDHPIVAIWSAHQQDEQRDGGSEFDSVEKKDEGAQCVLVTRPLWDVEIRVPDRGSYAFLRSLQAGFSLGMSIDKGNTFKGFDAAQALDILFTSGCVADIKKH